MGYEAFEPPRRQECHKHGVAVVASSYHSAGSLTRRLKGYVDSVGGLAGAVFDGVFVEDGVELARLSLCIQQALAASHTEVRAPRRSELGSRLPGLAGVKSFGALMGGAVSVDISSDGERIKLTPMRNSGAAGASSSRKRRRSS